MTAAILLYLYTSPIIFTLAGIGIGWGLRTVLR